MTSERSNNSQKSIVPRTLSGSAFFAEAEVSPISVQSFVAAQDIFEVRLELAVLQLTSSTSFLRKKCLAVSLCTFRIGTTSDNNNIMIQTGKLSQTLYEIIEHKDSREKKNQYLIVCSMGKSVYLAEGFLVFSSGQTPVLLF